MGVISYQCLSSLHWQKHLIDQCLFMETSTWSFNAKRMGTISYQCLLGHKHVAFNAKPMGTIFNNVSPLTQALNWSIPQKWAQSAINVYTDQLSMSTWTQVRNYQCQTYGHDLHRTRKQLLSCSNQSWVSISTNVHADRLRFAMQYKPPPYQYRASTMQ